MSQLEEDLRNRAARAAVDNLRMTQSDKDRLAAYDALAKRAKGWKENIPGLTWTHFDLANELADLAPTPTPDWSRVSTKHVENSIRVKTKIGMGTLIAYAVRTSGYNLCIELDEPRAGRLIDWHDPSGVEITSPKHPYWMGEDGDEGSVTARAYEDGSNLAAEWRYFEHVPEGCKQTVLVVTE